MEQTNQNQLQKSSQELQILKRQEILLKAEDLLKGNLNLNFIETRLKIENVFEQPLMRSVFKTDSEALVSFGVVSLVVNRFLESFGFSNKPSQTIIDTMVVDAISKFDYETLDDLIIFFKMCRQGDFGTTGRGLDSNLVFGEWLPKYLEIKADKRERYVDVKKPTEDENNAVSQYYAKIRKEKEWKEKRQRIELEIDGMVKNMTRQELEETITEWTLKEDMKPFLDYLKRKRQIIK